MNNNTNNKKKNNNNSRIDIMAIITIMTMIIVTIQQNTNINRCTLLQGSWDFVWMVTSYARAQHVHVGLFQGPRTFPFF